MIIHDITRLIVLLGLHKIFYKNLSHLGEIFMYFEFAEQICFLLRKRIA